MKAVSKTMALSIILFSMAFVFFHTPLHGEREANAKMITEWQLKWDTGSTVGTETMYDPEGWIPLDSKHPITSKPGDVSSAWIKFRLPSLEWDNPGIFIEKIYGQHLEIFIDERKIYEYRRNYLYDINRVLLPLNRGDSEKTVYIKVETSTKRLGLQNVIRVGDYHELLPRYAKRDLFDIIFGSSFIFIAVVMLICSVFLNIAHFSSWASLCFAILSLGIMVITYSPFLYTFYGKYGQMYLNLFDLSLFVFLPSLTFFFEKIFGRGVFSIIARFRKFQIVYLFICVVCMLLNQLTAYAYNDVYFFISAIVLGCIMIVQFLLLAGVSVICAVRGNKDAIILSSGFALFALAGIAELVWFYLASTTYDFFLWKWGVVCFVFALIIVLGRRFAKNHEQVVKYSKELEMYNNQLQQSEKMEIISQLAASVAHEVRNPLQVTRGFLQLLGGNTASEKEKNYLNLAIAELDRAANIITDFLTFAKPQLEHVTVLNLAEELKHVEVVLVPLANLEGAKINLDIPPNLYIRGNSSKFKQAFVNMFKNSIEALKGQGQINIWAYEERDEVVIHIQDNGEGMDPKVLTRLGEPYFSNKTKGTGLGLMVTFRIIEVMGGKVQFKSEKGVGTEAVVRFPSVKE